MRALSVDFTALTLVLSLGALSRLPYQHWFSIHWCFQALRQCGSKKAVILLDEVDKLTQGMQGDPASALLEVLDPAQNSTFRDLYIDAPFDLSEVRINVRSEPNCS